MKNSVTLMDSVVQMLLRRELRSFSSNFLHPFQSKFNCLAKYFIAIFIKNGLKTKNPRKKSTKSTKFKATETMLHSQLTDCKRWPNEW